MDVVDRLEEAAGAVAALAEIDVDVLSDQAIDRLLTAMVRLSHQLQGATCPVANRWEARSIWTSDGSRSARARLARDTATEPATAGALLRRARALSAMPVVAEALAAGRLSPDHVDLLLSARSDGRQDVLARDEQCLVDAMRDLRFAESVKVVDYWRQRADAELGLESMPPESAPSMATISTGVGNEVQLVAHLDPVDGAQVTDALQRVVAEIRRNDRDAGRPERSIGHLRAAALVEMARRAMAAPSGIRSSRPLLTVLCGEASFAHLCELSTGRVIAPGTLVPHIDELDVQTVLFAGSSRAIEASPRRTFAGALRRVIEARDRHCQHPSGCDEPIDRCDVDHVVPWSRGGATEQSNGRLLCSFHNRIAAPGARPPVRAATDVDLDAVETAAAHRLTASAGAVRNHLDVAATIVLIGAAAVGKSTVGELRATRPGRGFSDLDLLAPAVCADVGQSVDAFVAAVEADGVRSAHRWWQPARVHTVRAGLIAAAGGVVAFGAGHSHYEDREFADEVGRLLSTTFVALLRAHADDVRATAMLAARRGDGDPFTSLGMLDEWVRSEQNRRLADLDVVVGDRTAHDVVDEIVRRGCRARLRCRRGRWL